MNPYARFAQAAGEQERRFFEELRQWHDEMVLHQRVVRRVGRGAACSDDCPHAEGQRLWRDAIALLGAAAETLTFLRSCGTAGSPAEPAQRA